jgi:hypothetical protein
MAGFGPPPSQGVNMKIKMLVGLSGNEYSLGPGQERDFPQSEAMRLVAAGYAVPVVEQKIERAVAGPTGERRSKKGKADVVSGASYDRGDSGAGDA